MSDWHQTLFLGGQAGAGPSRHSRWALVGLVATYCYLFFALQPSVLGMWSHNVMVLALIVALYRAPAGARQDPLLWLALAAVLMAVLSYAKTHLFLPAYAESTLKLNKLLALFVLFPIAWWLGGETKRVLMALALALAGFGAALLLRAPVADWMLLLHGQRVAFGFQNPQHTAVFFAVALIGWTVFSPRLLRSGSTVRVLRYLAWVAVFAFLAAGLVVTQTRAAWLGLTGAMLVALIAILSRTQHLSWRRGLIVSTAMVFLVGMIGAWAVQKRFVEDAGELSTVEQVAGGDLTALPDSSTGIRIKLWTAAARWIEQRPLTGWGNTIRSRFIKESPETAHLAEQGFGHVHSSYLDILLVYGVVGLLLVGAVAAVVGGRTLLAWRKGAVPNDVMLFGGCFFAFWLIVNFFESYIFWRTGTYLVAVVGGAMYTFPLAAQRRVAQGRNEAADTGATRESIAGTG